MTQPTIGYFGTNLSTYGHYVWRLSGDSFGMSTLDMPFHFYQYPEVENGAEKTKGHAQFIQAHGYSIIAIEGSCVDKRGGTKSVFYQEGEHTQEEMIALIRSIPVAAEIINKMPFPVPMFNKA
jgi:hypothetical protein